MSKIRIYFALLFERLARWLRGGDDGVTAALREECAVTSRRQVAKRIGVSAKQITAVLARKPSPKYRQVHDWTLRTLVIPEKQITSAMIMNALVEQTAAQRRVHTKEQR